MIIEGQVGVQPALAKGSLQRVALGRQGEALVSEYHGRYFSLAMDGAVFNSGTSANVTIASTHVSPLAAGTGTPIISLYNPQASGKVLVVLKAGAATISGTPGGPLFWNYALNQVITATPNGPVITSMLNNSAPAVAKVFAGVATTGSTAGAFLRHAVNISAVAAVGGMFNPMLEDYGGDIIIPPGGYLGLAAFAAGTSHVVQASIVWAELNLIQ